MHSVYFKLARTRSHIRTMGVHCTGHAVLCLIVYSPGCLPDTLSLPADQPGALPSGPGRDANPRGSVAGSDPGSEPPLTFFPADQHRPRPGSHRLDHDFVWNPE